MTKTYNGGRHWHPGAVCFDGWPPFASELCLLYNQKPLKQYLKEEHLRMRATPYNLVKDIPENNTTLILCVNHVRQNVVDTFKSPQTKVMRKIPVEIRKRVKELALVTIDWIKDSWNFNSIIDCIQFFNILTNTKSFSCSRETNVKNSFWKHDILCPHPEIDYGHIIKFKWNPSMKHWCCDYMPRCSLFVFKESDGEHSFCVVFMDDIMSSYDVEFINSYKTFDNPYYCPAGGKYMNNNKYKKIALFCRLCIGARDIVTNQTSEGGFNLDKTHPVGVPKGSRVDEYIESELKMEEFIVQRYFAEVIEDEAKGITEEMDKTRKSKVRLSDEEVYIFEQFKKYVQIKWKGIYIGNRGNIANDFNEFYKNDINSPNMTKNKITDLNTAEKKISKRGNYIGYVKKWLNYRLAGA